MISASFGFTEAIKRLGVERRLYTAGENKSFLDPFLPEKAEDVARLKDVQLDMHASFKTYVTARRAGKLADDPAIFSGAFWTGTKGVALGLADGTGELRETLRQRFGDKVRMPVCKPQRSWFSRRFGGASTAADPGVWADSALAAVEERLIWDRYRL